MDAALPRVCHRWSGGLDGRARLRMAGAGCSWAGADTSTGVALAVTKNVLSDDFETAGRIATLIAGRLG